MFFLEIYPKKILFNTLTNYNMEEQVDTYNDRYEHIGTASKKAVHKTGQWHRSFICMLINPEKKTMILQCKVENLYNFDRPDYVDFTAGGHYQVGESIEDGIRELREEVGIKASFSELIPLGVRQTAHTINDSFIEYEFQHIFLYSTTQTLDGFTLEKTEVKSLVELDIQEAIDLLLGKKDEVTATSIAVIGEKKVQKNITLTRKEFVPSYITKDKIFVRLFIAAKRFIDGDTPEEIFV